MCPPALTPADADAADAGAALLGPRPVATRVAAASDLAVTTLSLVASATDPVLAAGVR